MGFNKRIISAEYTLKALENNSLKDDYGKSDMLIFEDELSSKVYEYYKSGKNEKEILLTIKNMEEKTNEVY
jgi:hypothetical protein